MANQDPHINPASGVWDDNYYANTGKYLSGGGGDIASQYISSISGAFPSPVTPFEQADPFSFDKQLAEKAATAEYDPYYKQLLSDYTKNVTTTIGRSNQDLKTTLDQLQQGKDYYTGTEGRMLDQAMRQTNDGYAGKGLFFSGARQRDVNQVQAQYQADTGNYNNQYQYNTSQANLANKRTLEDVGTAQSQYQRDTGQAEKSAIAQGVLQRQTEAQTQYEAARQAYYSAAQYGGQGAATTAANAAKSASSQQTAYGSPLSTQVTAPTLSPYT